MGNGIDSEAAGKSSFSVPGASPCNVYSTTGNVICFNVMSNISELSHTGDGICSDATGNSSNLLHMCGGICSNAATKVSCSDTMDDSSYSISSARQRHLRRRHK